MVPGWSYSFVVALEAGRSSWTAPFVGVLALAGPEVDRLGLHRPGGAPRRRLVRPVQVRMRDHLVRRRRSPGRLVLGRVRVADQGRVVPAGEGAVQCRADTPDVLGPADAQPPAAPARHDR